MNRSYGLRLLTSHYSLLTTLSLLLGIFGPLRAAYSYDFLCRSDTVQRVDPGGAAEFDFTITNTGNQPDGYQFDCEVISGVPDWYATYCVGGRCGQPGMVLLESLAVGASDTTAHVSVYTSTTPGTEVIRLKIRSQGNPALADSVTTRTLAGAGVQEDHEPGTMNDGRVAVNVFPNPVSDQALISYTLPAGCVGARLGMYDMQGRRWLMVAAPGARPGRHDLHWPRPAGLPRGVYLLHLRAGTQSAVQKLILE
jgi:hypothetical protein